MNNAPTINEQDIAVAEYLETIGVTYKVKSLQTGHKKDNWECDKWAILFNSESFKFHTGTGHRISKDGYSLSGKTKAKLKELRKCIGLDDHQGSTLAPVNNMDKQFASLFAVKPTQANVLYCLLLDMQSGEQTFYDWCSDLGYDDDSMKAHQIYLECQKIQTQMRKVFKPDQIEHLQELLQDY